jgi:hypothetical protein
LVVVGIRQRQAALRVEAVDLLARRVELDHAAVELVELDPLRVVVLRRQAQGVGADAHVDVLGDDDRVLVGEALPVIEGDGEDPVVHRVAVLDGGRQAALGEGDDQVTAARQLHPVGQLALLAELVEGAAGGAGGATELGEVALEGVDLLDHVDRDDHHVLLEAEQGLRVVQQDVGVEDEALLQRQVSSRR